ncbi:hypothetical protein [Aquipuribacter nitratireducens]|uniref:Uncharacterized protein n=1 Tax=Aquipuribacter nitratireducens TaxID=650104 RepID=A0ABW0GNU0_9MICO
MSTWLVVTTGEVGHQYDTSLPRPPLRDDGTLERWLAEQPEYRAAIGLWIGRTLTGEVHVDRRDGPLRTVSLSVSGRGGASAPEHARLRERLQDLADRLDGRLWDDDTEEFVD